MCVWYIQVFWGSILYCNGNRGHIHSTVVYSTDSGDGAGGECVDPILVPEQVQEMRVQGGLEVAHFQWVVPSQGEERGRYNRVFRMYGHI